MRAESHSWAGPSWLKAVEPQVALPAELDERRKFRVGEGLERLVKQHEVAEPTRVGGSYFTSRGS